ncbi:murein hydrolase activator EnvC [Carboxylicivirga sp. M1479]|uniref:murein hydrolase activator EnvC family protein n=1 Tax=Carboxylicivirga sp. M1479 TaxID=2594476 RepID=UPI001177BBFD|nr:M23 family metallopeptidase [Carboxylicivirga sp. M1479]TRX71661.1 peptidoglycan DD-metalloendopeptidase family protein [Carboxylicivirga sp. M1479]
MRIKRLLLVVLLLNIITGTWSQSLKELESEKEKISKRINYANNLLIKVNKEKKDSYQNVQLLNRQISDRQKLIDVYDEEIILLESDIKELESDIAINKEKLTSLKDQYSLLIVEMYSNKKRYNELSFFFGSSSFNEAYRRYAMLKEYNRFRHNQGVLIQDKSKELEDSYNLLNTKLTVQNNALKGLKKQQQSLLNDKENLNGSIKKLLSKESSLKVQIRKQKRALKKLEETIVKLIAELAKESVEPSDFHLSKGKMSWPVKEGVIISQFGEHKHPVLKYVKVNNNGIDIKTSNDKEAKCVFSGVVSRIVPIPGYNKAVLIRHGRFLTVYANLDVVGVKKGQNVTKNSVIGTIYSGNGENSGVLHFEIWEESVKLNPELWLFK